MNDFYAALKNGASKVEAVQKAQIAMILPNAATALSEIILQPVASQLENKRLLIVSDGILQYIPFAALTTPGKNTLLLANSKIVNAPSASTIAINRNETANRQTAEKTIAILADRGFFNGTEPELSGIVMSLVDKNGDRQNGFLYLPNN
ncbi:MAG: CHAT domain-containing protein [Okeania sp. SIO3B3]|nr:CHAT domain-containing protein [Okeania sp. SIO3B3]